MNDAMFIFVVVPLTLGFIGFMFTIVFGADILRWYAQQAALQNGASRPKPQATVVDTTEYDRYEPTSRDRAKELAIR